jgi:CubicO group peptidase (beta-lactamase class C family)
LSNATQFSRAAAQWTTCIPAIIFVFAAGCERAPVFPPAEPLPGQIIIDPEHPAWLKREGESHLFICGPGNPEDFLYRGRRNPDGTRSGDQMALIEKLVRYGGNCIYMQIVRTHGGDAGDDPRQIVRTHSSGDPTQNPFVDSDPKKGLDERILSQWEEWFTAMDEHGILIYLFLYDDNASIWDTGNRVGQEEQRFVEGIVSRFQHHRNLIWMVAEESEERFSAKRVQRLAEVIRRVDPHGHIIGNHHLPGTGFKAWRKSGALNHFGMQLLAQNDEVRQISIDALREADGHYQVILAENVEIKPDVDSMRRHAWSVAMAGLMPMIFQMDIANTPVEALQQCRYLQTFFESTDFYTMAPHDELRHAGTKYVLADPTRSYIAYSDQGGAPVGLKRLPPGACEVRWLDCRSGETLTEQHDWAEAGDRVFARPATFGQECVAWVHFSTQAYFPPPESDGGWRKLVRPADVRRLAGMDPDKLAQLAHWLYHSDRRDFAAVVIRNGYIVLEAERGRGARTNSNQVASVAKAICATTLAIASEMSQQGLTPKRMFFDDLAFQFIPWAQPLSDPGKAQITVRQLLNHTSGICPEATGAPNDGTWSYVLGHSGDLRTAKLAFNPGQGCGYSTHGLDHAALVCENVTGMPYDEFAIKYLFKPIGCERWTFQHFEGDRHGRHPTHAMGMPARDLARIAYCMLHNGRWNGRQVIPEWFIEDIAHPQSPRGFREMRWGADSSSYADGWQLPIWLSDSQARGRGEIPADARFKSGSGGQFIGYVPSLDLVIARQTGVMGDWEFEEYLRRACLAVIK